MRLEDSEVSLYDCISGEVFFVSELSYRIFYCEQMAHFLFFFTILVIIRVRPFLMLEKTQGGKKGRMQCVETYHPHDEKSLSLVRPGFDQRDYRFDSVLEMESSQDMSFAQIAAPVVEDVLNGFNGVIMAYGQTGSGKTHTIFGSKGDL